MTSASIIAAIILALLLLAGFVAVFFGLPGLFIISIGYLSYGLILKSLSWQFFIGLVAIAVVAEGLDWIIGILGARKFGTSKVGVAGALVGGIVGAIALSPIFLIGPIIGMMGGVWLGAFLFELATTKDAQAARKSAAGALLGRASAILIKSMIAAGCIVAILFRIF